MGTSIEQQMIELYCVVDDSFKTHPQLAQWRHSPYAQPQFSDAEVLTIALWQRGFEVATLKQTYRLVAQNWRTAFPQLSSYKQWLTRVHHLIPQVGRSLVTTCTPAWHAALWHCQLICPDAGLEQERGAHLFTPSGSQG